jgi:ABC-type sugar transport system substrate-binding protein
MFSTAGVAAVAVLATLTAAGCSSGSGASSSSSGSSSQAASAAQASGSSGAAASAAQAADRKALTAMLDPSSMTWPAPTAAFNAGSGTVAVITCAMQAGCAVEGQGAVAAAKADGWKANIYDGKFDPNVQASLVQQAIAQHVKAIVLTAIDVHSIKSAVDAATAAGIPVACAMCISGDMRGQVIDSSIDPTHEGQLLATYIGATVKPDANVVGFVDPAFPIVVARVNGVKEGLKTTCPACTWSEVSYPTSDASKPGPPTWTAFLESHPSGSVQWVATGYEAMAVPFAQTLQSEGRTDIGLSAFDDVLPQGEKDLSQGNSAYQASIASPLLYSGWAAADNAIRSAVKAPTWDATKLPSALITTQNYSKFKNPGDVSANFTGYQALFTKLSHGGE